MKAKKEVERNARRLHKKKVLLLLLNLSCVGISSLTD
jgi:hypothetical protein